jgi:hypothetical protein
MKQPDRQSVWLPTVLYEAIPYIYLGAGLALLAGLAYVGLNGSMSAVYGLSGIVSLVAGGLVLRHRRAARRAGSGGR